MKKYWHFLLPISCQQLLVEDEGQYKYDDSDQDFEEVNILPWINCKEQSIANIPEGVLVDFSCKKGDLNNELVISGSTAVTAVAVMDVTETEDVNADPRESTAIAVHANSTEDLAASNYADDGENAVVINNVAMETVRPCKRKFSSVEAKEE